MPPYLVTAIFTVIVAVITALLTYLTTRGKTAAEIGKLEAETSNLRLESQKISNELQMPVKKRLNDNFIGPAAPSVEVVTKGLRAELELFSGKLTGSNPIILTLALGKGEGYYDHWALRDYVGFLSTYSMFKGVVIVDETAKFLAYFPRSSMIRLLNYGKEGPEFVESINKNHRSVIAHYGGAVTDSFTPETTTLEALRKMLAKNLQSAVVLDEKERVAGIIDREQLIGIAVISMAE